MPLISDITTPEIIGLKLSKLVLTPLAKLSQRVVERKKSIYEVAKKIKGSLVEEMNLWTDYLRAVQTKHTYELHLNRIEEKLQDAN